MAVSVALLESIAATSAEELPVGEASIEGIRSPSSELPSLKDGVVPIFDCCMCEVVGGGVVAGLSEEEGEF